MIKECSLMATKHTDGCFQKAEDDEPLFTLLARDPIAPVLVRLWVEIRRYRGEDGAQELEAFQCITAMEDWRQENRPSKEPVTPQELERVLVKLGVIRSIRK